MTETKVNQFRISLLVDEYVGPLDILVTDVERVEAVDNMAKVYEEGHRSFPGPRYLYGGCRKGIERQENITGSSATEVELAGEDSRPTTFLDDPFQAHDALETSAPECFEKDDLFVSLHRVDRLVPSRRQSQRSMQCGQDFARRLVPVEMGSESHMSCPHVSLNL